MKSKNPNAAYFYSLCILCVGYLLCARLLFAVHQMKQWPVILAMCAAVIIALCALRKAPLAAVWTSIAYSAGCAAGAVFQRDGVDPGGGRTNNLWITWTAVFVLITIVGICVELLHKRKS